ncbi:MAG: pyridoxal phosphate-dependent aminotransferase [Candidatus Cloacimonetes bacterium]|nr:pyridoxal phosphate-dependent aminotransferase [Candidatus Cloacimonadota bacterium]
MNLSERARNVQASPIRKLKPFADAAKARGTHIYHLNIGQPDIATPRQMLDVYAQYDDTVLGYGPAQGLDDYRRNLIRYYKRHGIMLADVDNNEIIVTTAGSEAIVFAMLVTCNQDDEIIVPEPFYTNYNGFAMQTGVRLVPLTTHLENGFALPSRQAIEALIGPRTKAILFCNPGNPTGAVYTAEEVQRLADIALAHNLYIISDEVYREFIYDGARHTSILHIEGIERHAIMVDSISKRYSACGARVGCMVCRNRELMDAALKFAQARLCPPTIDQLAANAAIDVEEEYFVEVLTEYDKRRNIVFDALQKIDGVVCRKPGGAFYVIAKLPIEDSEDFALWLLDKFEMNGKTVMVAPCEGFYATPGLGKDEVRIAYVLNEEALHDAMKLFATALHQYRKMQGRRP